MDTKYFCKVIVTILVTKMVVLITKVWLSYLNYDDGCERNNVLVTITKLYSMCTDTQVSSQLHYQCLHRCIKKKNILLNPL